MKTLRYKTYACSIWRLLIGDKASYKRTSKVDCASFVPYGFTCCLDVSIVIVSRGQMKSRVNGSIDITNRRIHLLKSFYEHFVNEPNLLIIGSACGVDAFYYVVKDLCV